MIFLSFTLIFPTSLACTTPIVKNEYGVPVSLYGGLIIINGTKYPSKMKTITYNMTITNPNKLSSITVTLTPGSDLINYVYGSSASVPANWDGKIGMDVYIDGPSKTGTLYVTISCNDGFPATPEGIIYVHIIGRGNEAPKHCDNTQNSCGTYPNCIDVSGLKGCYEGYYRDYYCYNNMVQYSKVCTAYCCQSFTTDGYCTGNPRYCHDPTPSCNNECNFRGLKCINGTIYNCEGGTDGCYDLYLLENCTSKLLNCFDGRCTNESTKLGKIAYLCKDDTCNDGIEPQLIGWLKSNDWLVSAKGYKSWNNFEFSDYDLMMCSDEMMVCRVDPKSNIFNMHKNKSMPFVEIADYRYAQAAFSFGYIKNPYEYLNSGKSLYVTKTDDSIFAIFEPLVQIFSSPQKITVIPDYYLKSAIDLADVEKDNERSALFKVDETEIQGRYAYLGWFQKAPISNLTEDGEKLLNRAIIWAACGDSCLIGSNGNKPPAAILKITPNPTGYENQTIIFDASESYDPEGQPLNYYWNFGDGNNSGWIPDNNTTHVYKKQGVYNVTLIVSDGELSSKPVIKQLTILSKIKDKVAFICKDVACSLPSEIQMIDLLEDNGYYVGKGNENTWTKEELKDYDFMICTSFSGCNIHSWSSVYYEYMNDRKGFLEVPDYTYTRAAYVFGHTNLYIAYNVMKTDIILVGEDSITNGLTGKVYNNDKEMNGIFTSNVKVKTIAKLDYKKELSTMFKFDPVDNRGRYAYVGWVYKNSISDLTPNGKEMLLRSVKWVQCSNVEECS